MSTCPVMSDLNRHQRNEVERDDFLTWKCMLTGLYFAADKEIAKDFDFEQYRACFKDEGYSPEEVLAELES